MARSPSHEEESGGVKKGPWTPEEDQKLIEYVQKHGGGSWQRMPKLAGLNRCGKSCRLRWTNYLRPDIKRGKFSDEEEQLIIHLHSLLGNKWSSIATRLPGRTDNEIKNYWNTHLRKKLLRKGIDPVTHRPTMMMNNNLGLLASLLSSSAANIGNTTTSCSSSSHLDIINTMNALKLRADAAHLVKLQLLQSMILQALTSTCSGGAPVMEAVMNLIGLTTAVASSPAGDILGELQSPVLPASSLLKPVDEVVAVVPGSNALLNVASTSSFPASNSAATFRDSLSSPDDTKTNGDFIKSSDDHPLPSASLEGNWEHNLNSLDNLLNDSLLKELLEQIP